MSITMYQVSVPVFVRMFRNLSNILDQAAAYAEAKKIEPSVLLNARLFPDMFPLVRQVQIASDTAKACAARLAGTDIPRYEDTEASFSELRARIDKTAAYLATFKPAQIDGSEERAVNIKVRGQPVTLTGIDYLTTNALPNFFFHVTTAYAILRHNGLEIGKGDYLGRN